MCVTHSFAVTRLSKCLILQFFLMSLSKLLGNQGTSMDLVDTSRASSSDDICKKEKNLLYFFV